MSTETKQNVNGTHFSGKLVNAHQLLEQVFDPARKPSLRWLRTQTKMKAIPYIKIGHLIFFDVEMVREALATKRLVRNRMAMAPRAAVAA